MDYPKTLEELKLRNWILVVPLMKSLRPGVFYSAYTSPDNKYVANVDNSDGEVTIVFSRDPISVLWMHPKTRTGAKILGLTK